MVPVFSLNLFPPFIAPNKGNVFFGLTCSEMCLNADKKKKKEFQLRIRNTLQIQYLDARETLNMALCP